MTIREVLELCAKGKAEDLVLPIKCIDCKFKDSEIRGDKVFCYMHGIIMPYNGYCYLGKVKEPINITEEDIKESEQVSEAVRLAEKSLATNIHELTESQLNEPVSVEKYKIRGEWIEKQVVHNCHIEDW